MTKLWIKALMILVLVAPAGMIPADKPAITGIPVQAASMPGQPCEPFTLFPVSTAFGQSAHTMTGTIGWQLRNDKVHDNKPSPRRDAQARLVIAVTE